MTRSAAAPAPAPRSGAAVAPVFGRRWSGAIAAGLALALIGCGSTPNRPASPTTAANSSSVAAKVAATAAPRIVAMRRLTPAQYQNIIADVFGPQIVTVVQFDPLVRTEGLLQVGAGKVGITPAGFEQFENAARDVAAQVVSPANRRVLIPCAPAAKAFDERCARRFLGAAGRLLLRRPLDRAELDARLNIARRSAALQSDFYQGIASALSSLLISPNFLFVKDTAATGPAGSSPAQLDPFSRATELSFFLWNSTPDDELLREAERGALNDPAVWSREVDRLMNSPRFERGIRAFFSDMLAFDQFAVLEKDSSIYPAFNATVAADAREQVLRTVYDLLIVQHGDYRDLFTTRKTFLTAPLARLYRVPAPSPDSWGEFVFPDADPRAGIQTAFGFTALNAHPGRSSPTLRGRAIRELLLCQHVPDPPGNVDFSLFNNPNAVLKTARQRLEVHTGNPVCAGCHKLMDPIGLALENFDGAGQLRTTEGGAPIDASGKLDGIAYRNPPELGRALHDNPAAASCVVSRLYSYARGRKPDETELGRVRALQQRFIDDQYRIPALLRTMLEDPGFFAVPPTPVASALSASAATPTH
jgi:hypothetical protein